MVVDRADGIDADDADVGVVLLEVAADARDGAAGARAGHDGIDLSVGVAPYLRAGGEHVGLDVERVVVLVDVEGTWGLSRNALGGLDVVLGRVTGDVGRRDDDLGPEGLEHVDLLRDILSGMVKTQR